MNVKDFSPATQVFLTELNNDPRWHQLRKELKSPVLPIFKPANYSEAQERLWIHASGKQENFDLLMKLLFKGE